MATEGLAARRVVWSLPGRARAPLAVALVSCVLLLLGLGWDASRSTLHLDVDGHARQIRTHAMTVEAALHQAGVSLYPEDWVSPPLASSVRPGMVVKVRSANPVALTADSLTRQVRTHAATVGELLVEAGSPADRGDEVWLNGNVVPLSTPLRPDQEVRLRRAHTVVLYSGAGRQTVHTTAETVGEVLESQEIVLYPEDRVSPGPDHPVLANLTVTIERSLPIRFEVDGRTIRARTLAKSVAQALAESGLALVGRDRVEPDPSTAVRPAMAVRIVRVQETLEVEYERIPFVTIWVPDPELEIDQIRLAQAGQEGMVKRRFRIRTEDGKEVERALEDAWREQEPVTKTMAYGTKVVVRTLETPDGPVEYWRKMRVYTTSYTAASCGKPRSHPRYGYTRLGWWLTKGVVATDPTVIHLKSRLYVPGYGFARAGDTGGGVKGKFVDLGFDEWNYESWHWWTDVYLLTPVPPRSEIRWILPDWPRYPDRRR